MSTPSQRTMERIADDLVMMALISDRHRNQPGKLIQALSSERRAQLGYLKSEHFDPHFKFADYLPNKDDPIGETVKNIKANHEHRLRR